MDRDTKEITIGTHKFVIKTYATAREAHAIQAAYFNGTKVDIVGDQPKFNEIKPSILNDVNAEMIRQMVVSMDDRADDIVDRCLDLPNDEYQEIVTELDALVSKKKS